MEDINFKKFICYILNCIGATEKNDTKRTIIYKSDKNFYQVNYVDIEGVKKSQVSFKELSKTSYDDYDGAAAALSDIYQKLHNAIFANTETANTIKSYFNIKQLPKYIVLDDTNPTTLNVTRSIHQAFNLINVFFDAKSWYLKQYRDLQNPISRSGIIFNSDNKRKFYGGTKIEYKDDNKEVNGITYDQLLSNVLKDIIYMITDETGEIKDFDVITLYILSKINYYLAKRYAVLSLNHKKGELHKALEDYAKITEYDTKFFNNFTYYDKEDIEDNDFPRYYQREILKLLNAGSSTDKNDDYKSFSLVINYQKKIGDGADDSKISVTQIKDYLFYITIYKMYYQDKDDYNQKFNNFNNLCNKLDILIENIKRAINSDAFATGKDVRTAAQQVVNSDGTFKDFIIHDDGANDVFKVNCKAEKDDAAYTETNKTNINKNINDIIVNIQNYKEDLNTIIQFINDSVLKNNISCIFKALKPYIKKYSNNTFSSVYKSPTISYTVTPMNIRPLIDKRATETDLSNYAAQIASDSFLNSNKLPALPEVTTLDNVSSLFKMVGGSTNINNSSNVYRTIFNSILTTLNSKKIRLNESDREKVDKSLDNLEQTEQYLKSTLSDYAKYASATKEKGKEISYAEVQKFVNEYENKLREYNKNSAHMLKFIGKLTRYLIVK